MSGDAVLLGIDLGTSAVKALLIQTGGERGVRIVGESVEALSVDTPHPGWSEQDPDNWWSATCVAIRSLLDRTGIEPGRIAGIALSGQMHGATLLDRGGRILRPCILWNDQRAADECRLIRDEVGQETLMRWVGNPALAGFTAPKLLWVRRHEPEIYQRIDTVLLPKDYVNFRLTGRLGTEMSDASGTLLFDVVHRQWSESMLGALHLSRSMLPDVVRSTDVLGDVSAEAASATGLMEGTPVIAGGADNACAAVGSSVVAPGDVLVSLGTSGTVVAPTCSPHIDFLGRLHTFCHAAPDTWYLMGVVLSAGDSLRWLRHTVFPGIGQQIRTDGYGPYDAIMDLAAEAPVGSEGLLFLPYLSGERTPHGDPDARGVFFGLSHRHGRPHLARSVIEGVTFALADSVDIMRDLDVAVDSVRATGGGMRSPLWRRILADVVGARVDVAQTDAGPALGAALIAGAGVGVFPSIVSAAGTIVSTNHGIDPDDDRHAVYRRIHALYDNLYPALQASFQMDARLVTMAVHE